MDAPDCGCFVAHAAAVISQSGHHAFTAAVDPSISHAEWQAAWLPDTAAALRARIQRDFAKARFD